jgi:hypothetical protein
MGNKGIIERSNVGQLSFGRGPIKLVLLPSLNLGEYNKLKNEVTFTSQLCEALIKLTFH